jgi:hypothetical protein
VGVAIVGGLAVPGCYDGRSETGAMAASATDADDAGAETDGDDAPGVPAELTCEEIGSQPLRRISSDQYANILADLLPGDFGDQAGLISTFPITQIDNGFSTFASANTVSSSESIAIEDNAEQMAQLLLDNRASYIPMLMPCVSAGYMPSEIDGCIDGFIDEFGARAFRRPLTATERTIVAGIYEGASADDGPEIGLAAVVQYFLEAPALLYAVERGLPPQGGFAALDSWELATRLSLFLRNSAPDEELMAAAAEGRLVSREDVERQARRLVEEPTATGVIGSFHREWLGAFVMEYAVRDHEAYTPEAQLALRDEVDQFTAWFLAETDGSFQTLMTTDAFPVDPRLADLYGVTSGSSTAPHRSGLFTLASVMAAQSHEDRTSLIERGAFFRNHVLCAPTPPFPGNIDPEATLGDHADLPTARERLQPLMEEPTCAGCHLHINPFGFAFEVYDWAGVYRTTENGAPIDTTFELEFGSIEGSFAGPDDLLAAVAASEEAQACYATHAFRYALGRIEGPEDECALDAIEAAFVASAGDVRELMVAIAVSDAFMFRAVSGAE